MCWSQCIKGDPPTWQNFMKFEMRTWSSMATWLFKARFPRIEMKRYVHAKPFIFFQGSPKKRFPKEPIQATHLPLEETTALGTGRPPRYLLHDHPHLFLHRFTEAAHVDVGAAHPRAVASHPWQGLQKSRLRHQLLDPESGWSIGWLVGWLEFQDVQTPCGGLLWCPKSALNAYQADRKKKFSFVWFLLIVQNSGNDMQWAASVTQCHVYSRYKPQVQYCGSCFKVCNIMP